MPATFSTGTINQPDAGSVGLAMVEKIRDDIVAHAAWDLVEEFTPASSPVRWYVFKNLTAQSGLSADWYLIIGRTLGNGELRISICEDYNQATKLMSFFSNGESFTSQYTYDALGRFGGAQAGSTYTLANANFASSVPGRVLWVPSGTSTKYWIIVNNDAVSVAFNGASNGFFHAGAYIPLSQLPNALPIQLIGQSESYGSITRNPAMANVTTFAAGLNFRGGESSGAPSANLLGFAGWMNYNDKLQGNQRPVAEIGMVCRVWQEATGVPGHGYALGKQKYMRVGMVGTYPAGFAFGDAYVLNGKLWVPYSPTDVRIWDTGVAAS